jgi:5'-3' exonuclease
MGINGLKKFLREKHPDVIDVIDVDTFCNEKVGVDISSYIYKYKTVFGDMWLNSFVTFICACKRFNVHANFVFDGSPPKEKSNEREKRRNQKETNEENVMNLSFDLDTYKATQVASPLLLSAMEKIVKNNAKNAKIDRFLHAGKKKDLSWIDIAEMEKYIEKKEKQIVNITTDDIDSIKTMIKLFGGFYIQAPGEAEALCAYLSSIGELKAVITEDTDILAYSTEIFISDFNISTGKCEAIYLKNVLESLDLNMGEFLDFCIMCGNDYNNNIPNHAINKVFKFIEKFRSIELFIEDTKTKDNPLDYTILNHIRSRELFQTFGDLVKKKESIIKESVSEIIIEEKSVNEEENIDKYNNELKNKYQTHYWDTDIDFDKLYSFLNSKKCKYSPATIEKLWESSEIIFEDEEE